MKNTPDETKGKLNVLISSLNDDLHQIKKNFFQQFEFCDILISHQITNNKTYTNSFHKKNISYYPSFSSGLSNNRNNCIKKTKGEFNLIADVDAIYFEKMHKIVLETYKKFPQADLIIFKTKEQFSNKKRLFFWHNKFTILNARSIAISFRKSSIENVGIKFDERFGLGARFPIGEETIFVKDCIDAGLNVLSANISIVSHSHVSSGENYSKQQIKGRVAAFWRLYGPVVAFVSIFYFAIFRYFAYRARFSLGNYLKIAATGFSEYMKFSRNES